MGRKGGLGKGLDILIPQGVLKEEPKEGKQKNTNEAADFMVKISLVEPNKEQPRKEFDETALNELADSIKQYGIIQPLVVVKKDDHYVIVTGERRWRAAKIAGLRMVPVVVKNLTDQEIMELSLIENIQREDLNPVEEAMAYQRLIQEFHMTQDEIARKVSKSRTVITNTIRLLKLDKDVQAMLASHQITSGHARALLGLDNLDEQYDLATRIVEEGLSVRDTEELVRLMNQPPEEKEEKKADDSVDEQTRIIYENYENLLKRLMGTKVNIRKKKNDRGKIEIEYYSLDELERLLDLFQRLPGDDTI
ncbi:MAG: ParB/RepB/Spo0J family partition protein [Lachnospiraceae bacterium]|nr:ParB/RepB/Spo0J family partition protein [Lachnospiraceae bacterium]MDY4969017.1 ParB/RepB/Spo0J family partition protein [Lachnospiraceae bacterium]